jgi:hypothetical protein
VNFDVHSLEGVFGRKSEICRVTVQQHKPMTNSQIVRQ